MLLVDGFGLILPEASWRDSSDEQTGQTEKGRHVEGAAMCRVCRGMRRHSGCRAANPCGAGEARRLPELHPAQSAL